MSRVPMAAVYDAVLRERQHQIDAAKTDGKEVFKYSYLDFRNDCYKDELIVTEATLRSKWQCAVSDEVLMPFGKPFKMALLNIPVLEEKCSCRASCTLILNAE